MITSLFSGGGGGGGAQGALTSFKSHLHLRGALTLEGALISCFTVILSSLVHDRSNSYKRRREGEV